MTELRDVVNDCLDTFGDALKTVGEDMHFVSPAREFAAVILPRLKATFNAIALLLKSGYADEAVVLNRRQLEDSLRIHYMFAGQEDSDEMALGFSYHRERRVLKQMGRIIANHSLPEELRKQASELSSVRQTRIDKYEEIAETSRLELVDFPKLWKMAHALNRHADLIPYASASEVSHSALSPMTAAYTTSNDEGQTITIEEATTNPSELAAVARATINSTGLAVVFALKTLNREVEASEIARVGSNLGSRLKDLA